MNESGDGVVNNYGHFPSSMCFQNCERGIAQEALNKDQEMEAFYHLVESHAPYQRIVINALEKVQGKKLGHLDFNCKGTKVDDSIECLRQKISELPKEWTVVQLTPSPNINECYNLMQNTYYTNPIFLSVFTADGGNIEPIVIKINSPKDKCGREINLYQIFQDIIKDFKGLYKNSWNDSRNPKHKFKSYMEYRVYLDNQMKLSINQLSTDFLREWKCFLMSSFQKEADNELLATKLHEFMKEHNLEDLPKRNKVILKYIFRAASYLSSIELRRALKACLTRKSDSTFYKEFLDCSNSLNCANLPRNPLILILDEKLELYPWEMVAILQNAPVTRMPSLHFAHALYRQHKYRIVDGYLSGINYDNGTYLINPGQDLPGMQTRMSSFMSYWMPQWEGITGRKPTQVEYEGLLQKGDIFVYNGHGDGCQFLNGDQIKYLHINAVVFLFGCASVSYRSTGPLCSMHSTLQHYLSACCPCLLGMLYEVGDKDTDLMAASLMSMWIPSAAPRQWSEIDKKAWKNSETNDIESLPSVDPLPNSNTCDSEPNLLLALAKVKKNGSHCYITKGAFVARGLPVR